jgi:hypothetical protein
VTDLQWLILKNPGDDETCASVAGHTPTHGMMLARSKAVGKGIISEECAMRTGGLLQCRIFTLPAGPLVGDNGRLSGMDKLRS